MRTLISASLLLSVALAGSSLQADGDAANAQKLIDRAVKAMGGKAALAKTRNTIIEDKGIYYGMGDGVPYEGRYVYQYAPKGRYRMEIKGQFVSVVDKAKGWMSFMGVASDMEGQALEVAVESNLVGYVMTLLPLTKPNKNYKLTMVEPIVVDGDPCEGIKVTRKNMPALTIMFSKKTGLIRKTAFKARIPDLGFKEASEEAIYHTYKKFDGVMSCTKMTSFRDGKKFVESNPHKVTYPKKVKDSEFAKPKKK